MDNSVPSQKNDDSTLEMTAIEMPNQSSCCCSWTGICDVVGNRQDQFIVNLRPIKIHLIDATQRLAILQVEIERKMTYEESKGASESLHKLIKMINRITSNGILNVPPDENEMLRHCAKDLAVLARVIDQLIHEDNKCPHQQKTTENNETITSPPTESPKGNMPSLSTVDKHSLKERIDRNLEMLEKLLKFVDKKTERRWWLRDVINFAQLVVKLSLFISASIAVFYPSEHVFSVVTLGLAIAQGVIEVLYQYFLKNVTTEDIKMQVITTLSSASAKG